MILIVIIKCKSKVKYIFTLNFILKRKLRVMDFTYLYHFAKSCLQLLILLADTVSRRIWSDIISSDMSLNWTTLYKSEIMSLCGISVLECYYSPIYSLGVTLFKRVKESGGSQSHFTNVEVKFVSTALWNLTCTCCCVPRWVRVVGSSELSFPALLKMKLSAPNVTTLNLPQVWLLAFVTIISRTVSALFINNFSFQTSSSALTLHSCELVCCFIMKISNTSF